MLSNARWFDHSIKLKLTKWTRAAAVMVIKIAIGL